MPLIKHFPYNDVNFSVLMSINSENPKTNDTSAGVAPSVRAHFLNLYAMALADLTLDPAELHLLFELGERKGVERSDMQRILLNPHRSEVAIPEGVLARIECLYDFARMVWSDGEADAAECALLERFAVKFGFDPENAPEIAEFLLGEAEKDSPPAQVLSIVQDSL